MGNENNFIVETEGHCFFCSKHITGQISVNYETKLLTESTKSSLRSLQCFSRYLKMDMRKVFNQNDSVPHFLLEKVQKSVLKATLCSECANLTEKFSLLHGQLEKIKMEMTSVVISIQDKLKRADQNLPRLNDHTAQGEGGVVGKREIAKALRLEATRNCSRKLRKVKPRVKLQNLSRKRVDAFRNQSRHRGIQKEPQPDQNSRPEDDLPGLKIKGDVKMEYGASRSSPNMFEDNNGEYFEKDEFMDYGTDQNESSAQLGTDSNWMSNFEPVGFDERPFKGQETFVGTPSSSLKDVGTRKYKINSETGKFECCLCPKEFAGDSGVVFHYNAVHLNIKYKCTLCEKEFKYKTGFNTHLKSAHQGVTSK